MNNILLIVIFLAGLWSFRTPRHLQWFTAGCLMLFIGQNMPVSTDFLKVTDIVLKLVGGFTVMTVTLFASAGLVKERKNG